METENKKEFEIVNNVEINIKGVEVETTQYNASEVKKITFSTDKGAITWKPKIKKSRLIDGLKITSMGPMDVNDLPKKIYQLADRASSLGSIKVKASYSVMKTEKDCSPVTYRFINSLETFNKWELIEPKTEELDIIVN